MRDTARHEAETLQLMQEKPRSPRLHECDIQPDGHPCRGCLWGRWTGSRYFCTRVKGCSQAEGAPGKPQAKEAAH